MNLLAALNAGPLEGEIARIDPRRDSRSFAIHAAGNAKCPSSREEIGRFTAAIASSSSGESELLGAERP